MVSSHQEKEKPKSERIGMATTSIQNFNLKIMFNKNAELLNGRLSMLGIVAAIGAYALTGQVIPGIW